MTQLTHDEINRIIDSAKPHAKIVCDRIYNKTAEQIGGNITFKALLDESLFDQICEIEIKSIKDCFNMYFRKNTNISVVEIKELLDARKYIKNNACSIAQCGSGNKLTKIVVDSIDISVGYAFVEKLADYIGVDITHIINNQNED